MLEFMSQNWGWLTVVLVFAPLVTIFGLAWLRAWQLSLGAWMHGVNIAIIDLWMMNIRKVDITFLVNQLVVARQNKIDVQIEALTAHHLAGGNIRLVIAALMSAKRFGIPLTLERACAVDLVGEDPLRLISDAVHEANMIKSPSLDDAGNPIRPPVNPATVLLQASPGTSGVIVNSPVLTARVTFPQGELDVLVKATTVPKQGDQVRIKSVEGVTVTVEPV